VNVAYAPPRDPIAKARRRWTQWRTARPADLRFDAPLLSVCFDDFPASAAETGAAILEAHGVRGTFYAAAGLVDQDGPCGRNFAPAHVRRLAEAGHEIGCHTFDHADCARRSAFDTLKDIAANRDALVAMGAPAPVTLAFPYGETTTALKQALPPRFLCARGILPGLNLGRADLAQLHALPLYGRDAVAPIRAALKVAARRRAWLIVFTHDVADAPSQYGARASDLDGLLSVAKSAGFVVTPVAQALMRSAA
jgi:peptidoglycan/xylan/chitin deacetylase (PgdA/CDA1 family)